MTLGTFPQAISLILQLLDAFIPSPESSVHMNKKDSFIQQSCAWVSNGYQRLWKIVLRWLKTTGPDSPQCKAQVPLQFLASIQRHCNRESSLSALVSSKMDFTRILLQSLAELLALDALRQIPALQLGLSQFFDNLAENLGRSEVFVTCMGDILLPTLIDIKTKHFVFQALEPCLQVISHNHNPMTTHAHVLIEERGKKRRQHKQYLGILGVQICRISNLIRHFATSRICQARFLVSRDLGPGAKW